MPENTTPIDVPGADSVAGDAPSSAKTAGSAEPMEFTMSAGPSADDSRYAIGVDVGGTNTKVGVFDTQGRLLAKHSFATLPVREDEAHVPLRIEFDQVLSDAAIEHDAIGAIGLAVPGMILADDSSHVLPNVDLDVRVYKAFLRSEFSFADVQVVNDANAAILGDAWRGSIVERTVENLVFITLGTGVGGGVIVNGELVWGAHGAAGEVGHICVVPENGRSCKCGRSGCLEKYASATGLIRTAQELLEEKRKPGAERTDDGQTLDERTDDGQTLDEETQRTPAEEVYPDGKTVFDASMAGDQIASAAVDDFARHLAFGISQMACMLDPEIFILGGGLAGSSEAFLDAVRSYYREYALTVCRDTPIIISKLGNDCGIYGAAYHALFPDSMVH